jgi:hypothetical protein
MAMTLYSASTIVSYYWYGAYHGFIATSAVPIPGAIFLIGPGLVAVRRRLKKQLE